MRMQDVMTTRVETVVPGDSVELARERMRMRRVRHLVVMDGREVAGVVSQRDLPVGDTGSTVADIMSAPTVAAAPGTTLRGAANLMRGRTIGCLAILEDGKLVGIVTTTDLLELLGRGAERPVPRPGRRLLERRGVRRKPLRG